MHIYILLCKWNSVTSEIETYSKTMLFLKREVCKAVTVIKNEYGIIRGCHIVPVGHYLRRIFDLKCSISCKCQLKIGFLFLFSQLICMGRMTFFFLNVNF